MRGGRSCCLVFQFLQRDGVQFHGPALDAGKDVRTGDFDVGQEIRVHATGVDLASNGTEALMPLGGDQHVRFLAGGLDWVSFQAKASVHIKDSKGSVAKASPQEVSGRRHTNRCAYESTTKERGNVCERERKKERKTSQKKRKQERVLQGRKRHSELTFHVDLEF